MVESKDKLQLDIRILEDLFLKVENEIIIIENQLETKELDSDGSDSYFEWRKSAITAINRKRMNANSIKRQLNFWKEQLRKLNKRDEIQIKRDHIELIKQNKIDKAKEKEKRVNNHLILLQEKNKKDKEKTKRHKISEHRNYKIAREFKAVVKDFVGVDKYLELIEIATENAGETINKGK